MLTDPGNILDLSELNERVVSPESSPPPSLPEPQSLPDIIAKDPEPISIELPIIGGRPENLKAFRRKRKTIIGNLEGKNIQVSSLIFMCRSEQKFGKSDINFCLTSPHAFDCLERLLHKRCLS